MEDQSRLTNENLPNDPTEESNQGSPNNALNSDASQPKSVGKKTIIGVPQLAMSPSMTYPEPFQALPGQTRDEVEPETGRFTWEQKLIAFCLCLVNFTAYLSMSIIAPFFPREAAAKGMREAVAGFVFSIYALVIMLSSPIFGKLIPVVGAKKLLLGGVGCCGLFNIFFGFLDKIHDQVTFAVLCFLLRSFEALGAAAFCTASCTILIDQFPNDIGTVFGFAETCIGLGMSIGPAIGGWLYSAGGFGLPFFSLGTYVLLNIPFCWYLLKNVKDPDEVITPSVSYIKLLSKPHIPVVFLILAVSSQAQGFIQPTLEPHMRHYNLSTGTIGLLFLALSGAYVISAPIFGWISGKMENKYPLMITGLIFMTLSMILMGPSEFLPINGSIALTVFTLILFGISFAAAYVPTFESMFIAALNGGLKDDISTYSVVSGLWNCVYSFGEVTGPSLGGILSDFLNFPKAATIIASCTLVAFFVSLVALYNPWQCFGPYNLIKDAEEKLVSSDNSE